MSQVKWHRISSGKAIRRAVIVSAALSPLFALSHANATDYTWTGQSGPDNNWTTSGNWTSVPTGTYPNSTTTDTATFNGGTGVQVLLPTTAGNLTTSLTFDTSLVPTYTIGSAYGTATSGPPSAAVATNQLVLGSGGITMTASTTADENIYAPIKLAATQTWTNNGAGTLVIGDPNLPATITVGTKTSALTTDALQNSGSYALTIAGSGNFQYNAAQAANNTNVNLSGTGIFLYQPTAAGALGRLGTVTINSGELKFGSTATIGTGQIYSLNTGGTWDINGVGFTLPALQSSDTTAGVITGSASTGGLFENTSSTVVAINLNGTATHYFGGQISGPIEIEVNPSTAFTQVLSGTGAFGSNSTYAYAIEGQNSLATVAITGTYTLNSNIVIRNNSTLTGNGNVSFVNATGSPGAGAPVMDIGASSTNSGGTFAPSSLTSPIGKMTLNFSSSTAGVIFSGSNALNVGLYAADISSAGASDDIDIATGKLTIGATFTQLAINMLPGAAISGVYTLAEYQSVSGTFALVTGMPNGYKLIYNGTTTDGSGLTALQLVSSTLAAPSISLTAAVPADSQITNGSTGTPTAPVGAYSPNNGNNKLTVVYAPGSGYTPGYIHGLTDGGTTGIAQGYTQTTGFATTTETEIFLLKLDVEGTASNSTEDAVIVADINSNSPQTGLTASVPTGTFATLGGTTWDIELQFANPGANAGGDLDFNFTNYADMAQGISNVTVTDVAAVPEPVSASLMALGAAGIFGIRRRPRKPRV